MNYNYSKEDHKSNLILIGFGYLVACLSIPFGDNISSLVYGLGLIFLIPGAITLYSLNKYSRTGLLFGIGASNSTEYEYTDQNLVYTGQSLEMYDEQLFCPSCRSAVKETAKFCEECGNQLKFNE